MKIDNLISNLQKNAAEQDKIIKEQAESVTKQHLESYTALLAESNKTTKSILNANLKVIHDQQQNIKKALHLNMFTGAILGVLLTVFLGLIGGNLWLGKMIKAKNQELAELNMQIDKTPLEKRILRRVTLQESSDQKTYYIFAKNSNKADAYQTKEDQMVLTLEK